MICAVIAVKNCALVLIQLSTSTSVAARDRLRDVLGGEDVVHRDVDRRDAAGQVEQACAVRSAT